MGKKEVQFKGFSARQLGRTKQKAKSRKARGVLLVSAYSLGAVLFGIFYGIGWCVYVPFIYGAKAAKRDRKSVV